MPTASPYVSDTTAETFEADVVRKSMECLVLVDLWSPGCAPCRQLTPMLERVVGEFGGRIQLVKINVDASPELAQAFGVQGVPTVVAISQGRPVDQFTGLVPEESLREWLTPLVPSRTDELVQEGFELEAGDPSAAEAKYREAADLTPGDDRVKVALARVILAQQRDDEAAGIIADLESRGFLEPEAERVKSELELRSAAEEAGDVSQARQAAEADPDDLSLRLKLADALAVDRKHEEALQICLELIERDKTGIGPEAKETMVRIFDMLGPSSELTGRYRRELATAWY
ncbi:MAG: tetratricopeptide repeat protein [Planctomycetaceae bacterium]